MYFNRLMINKLTKMIHFFTINKIQLALLLTVLFFHFTIFSQGQTRSEKQFEKAVACFNSGDMQQAAETAEKIVEKDPAFFNAYLLLAEIAHESKGTKKEIEYLKLAQENSDNPVIYVRMAEAEYLLGEYESALENFNKYISTSKISEKRKAEIQLKIASCEFAIEAIKNPVEFTPEKMSKNINSSTDEYWPVLSLDQKELVFTRLIKTQGKLPQEDFFISRFDEGNWCKAKPISEINTDWNEGAETLSADGKLMFFTACNRNDGKGSCDIYFSKNENEKWSVPKNVGAPVNTSQWEGQPSFSSDNRYLYFSSNRSGGKGQKDIWRAEFLGFGNANELVWGKMENLGDSINTPGNEISPFIHANNKDLFFASDYHTGMGGMDLFRSSLKDEKEFSTPQNLGFPINTLKDEQGLNISSDGTIAFFASAREKDTGLDIYRFELDKNLRPEPATYVKAKITNIKTGAPVMAAVELTNLTNTNYKERLEKADNKGEVLICLPTGSNYSFTVSEDGFLFYSQAFPLNGTNTLYEPYLLAIELQPIEIGAKMNLYNVYYKTDSYTILPASEPELQKLLTFLKQNPDLKVEIQGHTDNTGQADKNQALSEKRAQSVVQFLVERGISSERLQAKGFGEQLPVATNDTEEGKRLNRRTTVKITGSKN